jgi:hypothetical protein
MNKYNCNDLINDKDIEKIYSVKEVSNTKLDSVCDSDDIKGAIINIYNNKAPINKGYILRFYYRNKEFTGKNGNGKVVWHFQCEYFDQYKSEGFGKKILQREIQLYQKEKYEELQINAKFDGIVVWRRLGLNYNNEEHELYIITKWREYLFNEYRVDKKDIKKLFSYVTVKSIPREYLYENLPNGVRTFTKWYNDQVLNDNNDFEASIGMNYNLTKGDVNE